jgi:hypothetical protein
MAKMNPQRLAFKEYYCNPSSETFGNALQSALKAGFAQEYAETITTQGTQWFSEIMRDMELKGKAEKVLEEMLDLQTTNIIEKGENTFVKTDTGLVKIKQDTAKFISETLNRDKYSKRSELTGKDGEPFATEPAIKDQVNKALDEYFEKHTG